MILIGLESETNKILGFGTKAGGNIVEITQQKKDDFFTLQSLADTYSIKYEDEEMVAIPYPVDDLKTAAQLKRKRLRNSLISNFVVSEVSINYSFSAIAQFQFDVKMRQTADESTMVWDDEDGVEKNLDLTARTNIFNASYAHCEAVHVASKVDKLSIEDDDEDYSLTELNNILNNQP